MKSKSFLDTALVLEEKRSTIIYFLLFYTIGLIYHVFYYYFAALYSYHNFRLDKFLILSSPTLHHINFPASFVIHLHQVEVSLSY